MLTRKLTHLEAHAIAHRLHQAEEIVAGVVEELARMDADPHGVVDDGEITGAGGVEFENGPVKCVKDCPNCADSTPAKAEAKCKACNGNDGDMPCAYPEGRPDCLRNASAPALDDGVIPADCDVRKILLRVVPGDGDGYEVYAKNVGDVENLLCELGQRLEDFELARAQQPQAAEPKESDVLTLEQITRFCDLMRLASGQSERAQLVRAIEQASRREALVETEAIAESELYADRVTKRIRALLSKGA